ncbi:11747_t:CDS:2 [Acaulospora colombiana]|uniref:11747_t:CDS:1 n=1 Tax=Acaulospora colombiana TaxID=27376 RepID=A0ACA9KTD2_9GLOM|nr:11747_t:CDS:2 [Acaulospora colombiana]
MSFMDSTERQELIQSYENQIVEYDKKFEELLTQLSWDFKTLEIRQQRHLSLIYIAALYHGKRKQVPSSVFFYQNSSVVLSLNKEELQKTAANQSANSNVGQSLTVSERLEEYEKEMAIFNHIREERKQQKRDDYQNFDEIWEAVQKKKEILHQQSSTSIVNLSKGENQGYKSRAEILAEQRDYKRRRKSYRAKNIRITQRTPTQVHRDLIAAYMEDFKLLREFEMESKSNHSPQRFGNPY